MGRALGGRGRHHMVLDAGFIGRTLSPAGTAVATTTTTPRRCRSLRIFLNPRRCVSLPGHSRLLYGQRSGLFLRCRSGAKVGERFCQEVQAHGRLVCLRFLVMLHERQRNFFSAEAQDRSGPGFLGGCIAVGGFMC